MPLNDPQNYALTQERGDARYPLLIDVSATPGANKIPRADGSGKLALGWLPQGSGSGLDADTLDGLDSAAFALLSDLGGYQPLDADLTGLAGLATTGLVKRTGAGTFSAAPLVLGDIPDLSSLYAPVAGGGYQPLDSDLTGLAALATLGFVKRTGAGAFSAANLASGDIPDLSATYLTVAAAAAGYQPLDSDLTTFSGLAPANGSFLRRTGGVWTGATLVSGDIPDLSATYLTVSAAALAYQPKDATLTALAAYNANGLLVQTAADTFAARSIAAGTGLSVSNGDGVAGNPTLSIDSTVVTLTGAQTLTNKSIAATQLTGTLQAAQFPALTGDVTTVAGALATTLAAVNGNIGSFAVATITVNAKGLVTAASAAATTGTGNVVLASSPTIVTPTIASLVNATHTHQDAAGGGTLNASAIAAGTLALARGGTNADLSASGGVTLILAQDASHVISARSLVTADLPTGQGTGVVVYDQAPTITNSILNGATTDVFSQIQGFSAFFQALNAQTAAAATVLQLDHVTSGTPTTNFGVNVSFTAQDDTSTGQSLGSIRAFWANAVHASRVGNITIRVNSAAVSADVITFAPTSITVTDAVNFIFSGTTGTKFGTATSQKIGFFNVTPVIQPTNSVGIDTLLVNLGLRAASGTTAPFDNPVTSVVTDSATAVVTNALIVDHESSGTPAASFGAGLAIRGKSTTTAARDMARLRAIWTTATDASRVANLIISVFNTAEVDILTFAPASPHIAVTDARDFSFGTTTGTKFGTAVGQKIGFWNATPIVQPSGAAQAAVVTTASTQTTPWGYSTQAQADAIVTLLNAIRTALVNAGLMKGSA